MKKLLLATVFGLASFSAQAQQAQQNTQAYQGATTNVQTYADITNPFYIPEKAFLADTTFTYSKERIDASINAPKERFLTDGNSFKLSEMITYGLTDTWAIYGGLAYDWTKKDGLSSFGSTDMTIGTKVNTVEDVWRVQIGMDVTWTDYTKWKKVDNEDKKDTQLYVMAGTETSDKVFAYTKVNYQNIDYGEDQGYDIYSVQGAAHILVNHQTTADVGLDFSWDTLAGVRSKDLTFFAGGNMNIYQNMTVGLFGDYVLASENNLKGSYDPNNQGTYTLGVNLKYQF